MLFPKRLWDGLADGSVTLAFRRWRRPAAKAGSRHRVPTGVIEIDAVDVVAERAVTAAEAHRAGYRSRDELLGDLAGRDGDLYRVRFHFTGADPRAALRDDAALSADDIAGIRDRLDRYDERSRRGPWTDAVLHLVDRRPATRAAELAVSLGVETKAFKADVRKLKELGLTESLDVGYRLSPRGRAYLAAVTTARRTRGRARS